MANALESASLVMIPSGYEDGTLGSLKPTDGTGDFTFSRGSDISATRISANGYIEKGYENLLLNSNLFDNGGIAPTIWQTSQNIVTGGQAGYDGSNDAWLIDKQNTSGTYIAQSISKTGVHTISLYAKAGSLKHMVIWASGGNVEEATFLLEGDGSITRTFNTPSASIQRVGTSDWYRCEIVVLDTSQIRIYPASSGSSVSGTLGNIYIQDAMLNQGLVAYPYIETTTAPVAGGILEDMPRLDYSNGSCPALKLEPQRTNLVEDSEYFADRKYSSTIITQNYGISPEGVVNSALIDKNGVAYGRVDFLNMNLAAGSYTFSLFVKGSDVVKVRTDGNAGQYAAYINCATGAVSAAISETSFDNYYSVDYGNGWYRFIGIVTTTSDFLYHSRIYVMDVVGGEGNTNPATAEIYGYQVEQDATYETSYIPTYGVSQTRLADVCVDAGDVNTFNSTEGVLYAEISALANENLQRNLSISDGTHNNTIKIGFSNNSNYIIYADIRLGGVNQAFLAYNFGAVAPTFKKCAIKYKQNDFALWIDGVEVATDTSGDTFPENTLNTLSFTRGNNVQIFEGKAKQVLYFPTALTDDECIELTTI